MVVAGLLHTMHCLDLCNMLASEILALSNKLAYMKKRTLNEMDIYNLYDYEVMTAFCFTLSDLGLVPNGLDVMDFEFTKPDTHYASACFKFWTKEELTFAGSTIVRSP